MNLLKMIITILMNNKKGMMLLLIVAIVIFTAGGSVWLLTKKAHISGQQYKLSKSQLIGTVSNTQQKNQTEKEFRKEYSDIYDTRSSTINAYKYIKAPFSFKYDNTWQLDETMGGITLTSEPNIDESEKIWVTPSIKCETVGDVSKIKDQPWCYFKETKDVSIRDWCEEQLPKRVISKAAAGDTNDTEGLILYTIIYQTNSGSYQQTCITKNTSDYVMISFPKNEKFEQISSEILGSFTFL